MRKLLLIILVQSFCGLGCSQVSVGDLPEQHIPRIAGEWQELYRPDPETVGMYINDHTLFQHTDGSWHLIGITSLDLPSEGGKEEYFAHGIGESLIVEGGYKNAPIVADHGEAAWAPHAVLHNDLVHLFYSPVDFKLITSKDMKTWSEPKVLFRHEKFLDAEKTKPDWAFRDGMVLKVAENKWLMYATRIINDNTQNPYSAVGLYESDDLINWEEKGYALRTSGDAPYNLLYSSCESPFVMKYGEWYYLAFTYIEYGRFPQESYMNTIVFRSVRPNDPTDFGNYDGDDSMIVTRLKTHAPEFVVDPETGEWYVTTCGWPGYPNPNPGAVSIAPLEWDVVSETKPNEK